MKIETILTPAELPALAQRDLHRTVPWFSDIHPSKTAVAACRSAVAVPVTSRRWFSFLR